MAASGYYQGGAPGPNDGQPQYPPQAYPDHSQGQDKNWNQQGGPGGYYGPPQQPGMSMQHSSSYGPPANYANQGYPQQQYGQPPPGVYVQQPQYQQQQQQDKGSGGGFCATCFAVCAGMCFFDMCCDCFF